MIEELRQRSLYNAYEEFYANEFLINYLSFVTNYEKLFGEMEKEIEAIINFGGKNGRGTCGYSGTEWI